ncbi:unnamed protein product [Oikopleura dioica]|uniref:Sulfotransferase n=1 Tax=Oikopleura dioica TaxID=34765 RepID=E4WUC4_OIKDI|nr:unnamed protein product [Oikopleura dioica]
MNEQRRAINNLMAIAPVFSICCYFFVYQIEENISIIPSKEELIQDFSFRKSSSSHKTKKENKEETENEHEILYEKRLPDFIITGMQKCGTTVLKYFLEAHPKLITPKLGEIHFFEKDWNFEQGKEWYLDKMPNASPELLIFEKTPDYMAVPIVAKRIFEMKPDIKIIVLTCDPVKRAFSNYLHLKSVKRPPYEVAPGVQEVINSTFEEAILSAFTTSLGAPNADFLFGKSKINEKKKNELKTIFNSYLDKFWEEERRFPMPASLLIRGHFTYFMEKWLQIFPSENFLTIDGNLLTAAPWKACSQVEEFLKIENFFNESSFTKENENSKFYCIKKHRKMKYCSKPGGKKGRTLSQNMTKEAENALMIFYDAIS